MRADRSARGFGDGEVEHGQVGDPRLADGRVDDEADAHEQEGDAEQVEGGFEAPAHALVVLCRRLDHVNQRLGGLGLSAFPWSTLDLLARGPFPGFVSYLACDTAAEIACAAAEATDSSQGPVTAVL